MTQSFEARRTNSGVTLEGISEETKISVRILRSIENGDFTKLPGGIYSTSYIRQYARLAHIEEQEVLEAYERYAASKRPVEDDGVRHRSSLSRLAAVIGS